MGSLIRTYLRLFTQTFAIWVVVFGIVAYVYPEPFVWVRPGLNWFFALTMFGIGVVLEPKDFQRIAEAPWIVLIGVVAQFTLMPLGGFLLARAFHLPAELAVGLILTGCAPGAMASNVMSYIAKADVAYSVSLTAVSTLLCPVLTPALTLFLAGAQLPVGFLPLFQNLVLTVVLPLLGGFLVRHLTRERIRPFLEVFPAFSSLFIILICSMVIALNKDYLTKLTVGVFLAVVILNVYGLASGFGVGWLFRMEPRRRRTLAIEIGMQNAGLGTVLALNHIGKRAAIPAAIFVFVCIVIPSLLAAWWQRERQGAESAVAEEAL